MENKSIITKYLCTSNSVLGVLLQAASRSKVREAFLFGLYLTGLYPEPFSGLFNLIHELPTNYFLFGFIYILSKVVESFRGQPRTNLTMNSKSFKQIAEEMIQSSLEAVEPFKLIQNRVQLQGQTLLFDGCEIVLSLYKHIYVLGIGKAAAPMAAAFEEILGPYLTGGAVIVKYGHSSVLKRIEVFEASHPVPDENTLRGTNQLLQIAATATQNDLVLFLISGGGSALCERLPGSITLDQLITFNDQLLSCGASIAEINILRKHISLVKGGRFAGIVLPARLETFILSDVIGDPIESIASGPAAPDSSTYTEAFNIIKRYKLSETLPAAILDFFARGLKGEEPETPKPGDAVFKKVQNTIIGNNRLALENLQKTAEHSGFKTRLSSDHLQGDVREISVLWAELIEKALQEKKSGSEKMCIIAGGEPTVTLRGDGLGGRNQELTLAVLQKLKHIKQPFYFCSVGTDGTDGPTDAAGAWIDQNSFTLAEKSGLDVDDFLNRNDSYHFFDQTGNLIKTGPTGTNVMDIMFCLL